MVRLLLLTDMNVADNKHSFNPTMVRLLPFQNLCKYRLVDAVSIPLWCDCYCKPLRSYLYLVFGFNPTMVRLLPERPVRITLRCACFNPTMVRLLLFLKVSVIRNNLVSIPLWCDCYLMIARSYALCSWVSIPLWCDCYHSRPKARPHPATFQSHYGAIATTPATDSRQRYAKFQSHYGAIATM